MKYWKQVIGSVAVCGAAFSANAMVAKSGLKPDKKLNASGAEAVEGEFVVKLKTNTASLRTLSSELGLLGLSIIKSTSAAHQIYTVKLTNKTRLLAKMGVANIATVDLRATVLSAASQLSGVEYIEPNFIYRIQLADGSSVPKTLPNDASFAKLWGMDNEGGKDAEGREGKVDADIDAPEAWTVATGSKDIVVAVIDTGVDYTHPDLVANMWTGPNGIHGYNAIDNNFESKDDHSHGTHCSGTIGGMGNNGQGVTGINWYVSIMGVKFLSAEGSGSLDDAVKAIDWATEHGARVLSNSWGGGGYSQALKDAIQRASDKNILFIAAAGNESNNNDSHPSYPASYDIDNVIAVAASNNQDTISSFSNYGKKVHLMAPGENIYSTVLNGGYDTFSGTSMATPHVAGAAALLLSKEPSLKPIEVRERLMATSDKFKTYRTKLASAGRLNLYNMITNTIPPGFVTVPDSSWAPVVSAIQTGHPYESKQTLKWEIHQDGATYLRLHFAKFATEANYDKLVIKDKAGNVVEELTGALGENFWTSEVEGDSLTLEWTSDATSNDWGFAIDQFGWSNFTAPTN